MPSGPEDGGTLIFSTPNIGSMKRRLSLALRGRFPPTSGDFTSYDGGHLHYWTCDDIVALAGRFGFQKLHITGLGKFRKIKELWPNLLTTGAVFLFRRTD